MSNVLKLRRQRIEPELISASESFVLGGEKCPGFPILLGGDGGVVDVVAGYLEEVAAWDNKANGTVLDEARILLEYWRFLEDQNTKWTDANDHLLRDFARLQEKKKRRPRSQEAEDVTISKARVQRKLNTVFRMYYIAQTRLGLVNGIMEDPLKGEVGNEYPISVNVIARKKKGSGEVELVFKPRFRYTTLPKFAGGAGRPTPSSEGAEKVFDKLLDVQNDYVAARNWLCANWMFQAGLRRGGVAGLTTKAIAVALAEEDPEEMRGKGRPHDLADLADDQEVQFRILDALQRLLDQGRSVLQVRVTEKKSKTRYVPAPIPLIRWTLEYIWGARQEFITRFRARRSGYRPPDALWLAERKGSAIAGKTITNDVLEAFRNAGVKGSGHRLRAAFCTERVRVLYLRARAIHGRNWDAETILATAADEMGHDDWKTLRPYLNRVVHEEQHLFGEPVLVLAQADAEMFRALADAVNDGNERLGEELRRLMEQHGLTPVKEASSLEDVRAKAMARLAELNALSA